MSTDLLKLLRRTYGNLTASEREEVANLVESMGKKLTERAKQIDLLRAENLRLGSKINVATSGAVPTREKIEEGIMRLMRDDKERTSTDISLRLGGVSVNHVRRALVSLQTKELISCHKEHNMIRIYRISDNAKGDTHD